MERTIDTNFLRYGRVWKSLEGSGKVWKGLKALVKDFNSYRESNHDSSVIQPAG
jgi:hypothetical protein